MPATLSQYWKKRDFTATPEPKGEVKRPGKALGFVIQKHAASRLHYDFRLELDGTLVSWAVPKGPSLDPKVRRMAVHVEDHPLSYSTFEGVIPKGHYGAGTVEVWDRGTWQPLDDPREGLRSGKIKFEMNGEKLRGRWMLVRIKSAKDERQEPWLLIKEHDEEARPASEYDIVEAMPQSVLAKPAPAALPLSLFPQLATLVEAPPQDEDGWIYEVKFDGYRLLARIDGDDLRLFTRNGNDWTSRMKGLADEIAKLGIASAWIDGEIVVMNAKGLPDFQKLQGAFDSSRTDDIIFFAFDLPYFDGHDLRRVPQLERRALLQKILAANTSPRVRFSEHFAGPAAKLLDNACEQGLEGLIGKRANAPYTTSRSTAWIKLKCTRRQEFVIVGYTDPKGSRSGFGALLLGYHDAQGKLHYAGNVGTGFDEKLLRSLTTSLRALDTGKSPLALVPRGVKGHWVKPRLVAEVAFAEWTSEGRIRHPVFHGLRNDRDAQAITREKAVETLKPAKENKSVPGKPGAKKSGDEIEGITVTHGERVIDAQSKATKLDLVRYYAGVADSMLAHLEGRPIALVRAPQGIGGELFFQKHGEKIRIPGIKQLSPRFWPGHPAMLEIASREALVGAAQMNVIELHTWNSTTADITHPDRVIFDLDPGEGIDWPLLKEATALMQKMLDMLEVKSFLKTSGGKGLHVVVPLTPKWNYDAVKDWSEQVVQHMARTIPSLFVSKSGPRNRVGRIFVDYLRNGRGATTVAAFSARSRPGLGVSVPVKWSELPKLTAADQWNIFNLHERLTKLREDPWKDYWKTRQTLEKPAKRLKSA